jgi:hypothetical protein
MRTWEHIGNKKKKTKNLSPPQKKKLDPHECMCEPSHWLHETFTFKVVYQHFLLGLLIRPQTMGKIWHNHVLLVKIWFNLSILN